MEFPKKLKYTKDHEWLDPASNRVGVTAYAVDQLGDIVHMELPSVGKTYQAGEAFGTIESTKTVSDLYMPVSCKIVEVNDKALKAPEGLQKDSYNEGWLIKIDPTTPSELAALLSPEAYESFVKES